MTTLEGIQEKIMDLQQLEQKLKLWNSIPAKIVFTNGCFDLIHRGHIDYLSKAADLGDKLIIGVNTDASVSKLKGSDRPIIDEYSRALLLAAFSFVSAIVFFGEETPYELIKIIQPDVLVKGADYKVEDIVGYDIVMAKGGNVVTLNYLPGFSTTLIENKIRKVE